MKILLTNDDGYKAKGLTDLRANLDRNHETFVVAPKYEKSGASHSLSLNNPIRINYLDDRTVAVEGTPVDCVIVAMNKVLEFKPDLLISGINHGPNLGDDVLYSGTVGGAREGTLMGIPSMAVSVTSWKAQNFDYAFEVIDDIIENIIENGMPDRIFYNINVPDIPSKEIQGINITSLDNRIYENALEERIDPRGQKYYWISGKPRWGKDEKSDYFAIKNKRVSISPIALHSVGEHDINQLRNNLNKKKETV